MTKDNRHSSTQVVGFRIDASFADALKAESKKRGLKLNQLLLEMWEAYKVQERK